MSDIWREVEALAGPDRLGPTGWPGRCGPGCGHSEESWRRVSGSWQRECEAGVVGRNGTQNRSKAAGPRGPSGRPFTKSVCHVSVINEPSTYAETH